MIPAVAVERYVAYKEHENYEHYPLSKNTIRIISVSWVLGFAIAVGSFFIESHSRFHELPFCSSFVFMSYESSILLPCIQLLSQIGGLALYMVVYRNSRRTLANYYGRKVSISLSSQFSLRQITDMTGAYLPTVCFNGLCLLLFFVPATIGRHFHGGNVNAELKVSLLTEYLGFLLQAAFSSIIVLLKCNVIRQVVASIPLIQKLTQMGGKVRPESRMNEGDARFLHLQQIWDEAHELAERRRSSVWHKQY